MLIATVVWVLRLLVAGVFGLAAWGKFADLPGTVGVSDEVVLPGAACDTVTLPEDASQLVIENLSVSAIGIYPDGTCTGTVLATVPVLGTVTVADPTADLRPGAVRPMAGGHQVGLALELEQ